MALFLYRLFLVLYQLTAAGLALFSPKVKKWVLGRKNWQQKWTNLLQQSPKLESQPVVWMHVSSLGEFEQGSPLLAAIKQLWPTVYIVVTFFSPSGYEVRKNYRGAEAVGYLPFDHPSDARKFVALIKPDLVIWVKYDYWYFILKAIAEKQISMIMVSGIFRESQPFFKWYGSIHREMLSFFSHFFLQTAASSALLDPFVPASKKTVAGDTRFDAVIEVANNWQPNPQIFLWLDGAKTVIVAGSTWPSDEEEMVHFAKINPAIKWLIAPHHVDTDSLKETRKLFSQPRLYSELNNKIDIVPALPNVLIIDNVGMLKYLYKYGTICYIGGGFTGGGIHNVLEAAVYGKPIMHGPEYSKFHEAQGLLEAGASSVIHSALQLEKELTDIIKSDTTLAEMGSAASTFVHRHGGATQSIMRYIQENLLLTSVKKR